MPPRTEADTCRQYVAPKLYSAGWDDEMFAPPLAEQRRIVASLDDLQAKVDRLKALQAQTAAEPRRPPARHPRQGF